MNPDDSDAPPRQVMTGATADPVKDYLKQIAEVAPLNAEQAVALAKRIEAGLFAGEQVKARGSIDVELKGEFSTADAECFPSAGRTDQSRRRAVGS